MTTQTIIKITPEHKHLTLMFSHPWFQEDIESLTEFIFLLVKPVLIQEKILGADRENIRFSWQGYYFILNFDCCSQSCWVEGQDDQSNKHLVTLYSTLIK